MSNTLPTLSRDQIKRIAGNDRKALQGLEELFSRTWGTFTPSVYGSVVAGAPAYATREGRYTKIANRIFGTIWIVLTGKGGMAGNVCLGDLPYAIADTEAAEAALSIAYVAELALGANAPLFGCGTHAARSFTLYKQAAAGAPPALTDAEIGAGFVIKASFQYEIDP